MKNLSSEKIVLFIVIVIVAAATGWLFHSFTAFKINAEQSALCVLPKNFTKYFKETSSSDYFFYNSFLSETYSGNPLIPFDGVIDSVSSLEIDSETTYLIGEMRDSNNDRWLVVLNMQEYLQDATPSDYQAMIGNTSCACGKFVGYSYAYGKPCLYVYAVLDRNTGKQYISLWGKMLKDSPWYNSWFADSLENADSDFSLKAP